MKILTCKRDNTFNIIIVCLVLVFIISRILVLFFLPIWLSDVYYYAEIGKSSALANLQGLNIYDVRTFEYPPLVTVLLNFPNIFIDINTVTSNSYINNYVFYYRCLLFIFDCFAFILLIVTISHLFNKKNKKTLVVLAIYIFSSLILFNLVYDRLDLILMVLVSSCYYFQIKKKFILSAIFLSLSIFFKMIPLLLIPLWCLGWGITLNIREQHFWELKNWRYALKAFLVLIISGITMTALSVWFYGPKVFDFLVYHKNRGIQIESIFSSVIQITNWFGLPYSIETSYGSQNVVSAISPIFSKISPLLIIFGIGLVIFKLLQVDKNEYCSEKPFAIRHAKILGNGYLASILAILIFSKVLSTQYFFIFLPFIAIFLSYKRYGFSLIWIFLLILTTLIFPYLYRSDIISITNSGLGKTTLLGTVLLLSRNFLLVYVFYYVYKDLDVLQEQGNKIKYEKNINKETNFNSILFILGISIVLLIINLVSK